MRRASKALVGRLGRRGFSLETKRSAATRYEPFDLVERLRREAPATLVLLDASSVPNSPVPGHLLAVRAKSRPHLTRMAGATAGFLRERAPSRYAGAGKNERNWLVVDGGHVVVSIAVDDVYRELALEEHWTELGARVVHREAEESRSAEPLTDAKLFSPPEPTQAAELADDSIYLEVGDDLDGARELEAGSLEPGHVSVIGNIMPGDSSDGARELGSAALERGAPTEDDAARTPGEQL